MNPAFFALTDALARQLRPGTPPALVASLSAYAELVEKWSRRTNLTGARTIEDLVEVLLADALVLAAHLEAPSSMVDVGSGGGAPALPLLMIWERTRGVLVEPTRKKVTFLRTAIGTLRLSDRVKVWEGRLEPGGSVPAAPFELATSRATFDPEEWLKRSRALADRTVVFGVDEIPAAPLASVEYRLPRTERPRRLAWYANP